MSVCLKILLLKPSHTEQTRHNYIYKEYASPNVRTLTL